MLYLFQSESMRKNDTGFQTEMKGSGTLELQYLLYLIRGVTRNLLTEYQKSITENYNEFP
jgi:hypothetical protein